MLRGIRTARNLAFLFALAADSSWAGDAEVCPNPAPPACEQARRALTAAEDAVQAAAARLSLWSTAADALKQARSAFHAGDYATARSAAQTAAEQARLGIAQRRYPMFDVPQL